MPEYSVGNVTLSCEQAGQGFPLLLISGTGLPAAIWALHMGWLTDVRTVIAFDNRDCGRSSFVDHDYTPAEMAADAVGLLDALGVERADVLGYSLGGAVAQELVIGHPDRVRSLVLYATWASTDEWLRLRFGLWERIAASAPPEVIADLGALDMFTHRFFEDPARLQMLRAASPADPDPRANGGFIRQWRADQAHDARDRLKAIACPTLVVSAEEDVLVPPRYGHELAELIPEARLEIIRQAGHGALIERADAFRGALEPFLKEI
jgi:pimeloyl-ACP methyl ester carboxylesterase